MSADYEGEDPEKGVHLSFKADLAPLELGDESLDGTPITTARGVESKIVNGQKFLNLSLKEDRIHQGKKQVLALLYLYDGQNSASFWRWVDVSADGKGISFNADLSASDATPISQTGLQKMINKKLIGAKFSLIIGFDAPGADNQAIFRNKGAKWITAGGETTLPSDYVMLKSEGNELEERTVKDRPNAVQVKGGGSITLKMQGYLLAVRFQNKFPKEAVKMAWKSVSRLPYVSDYAGEEIKPVTRATVKLINRPAAKIRFNLTGLSALYENKISFNTSGKGSFSINPYPAAPSGPKQTGPNYLTSLFPEGLNRVASQVPRFSPNNIGDGGVLSIAPEGIDAPTRGQTSLVAGESFITIYCPNPNDTGKIGWEPYETFFYDGSAFSSAYVARPNGVVARQYFRFRFADANPASNKNKVTKKKMGADGKIYPILFIIHNGSGDAAVDQSPETKYGEFMQRMFKLPGQGKQQFFDGYTQRNTSALHRTSDTSYN